MRLRSLCGLAGLALLAAGCTDSKPSGTVSSPKASPPAKTGLPTGTTTKLPEPVPAANIELKSIKYAEFEKIVADNKGKVIVVDFWAES